MNDKKETISDINVCGYITSLSIKKRFEYQKLSYVDLIIILSDSINLLDERCCKKLVFLDVQDLNISNAINGTYYCRFIIRDIKERQLECCNYSVAEEEMNCVHFFCKEYALSAILHGGTPNRKQPESDVVSGENPPS